MLHAFFQSDLKHASTDIFSFQELDNDLLEVKNNLPNSIASVIIRRMINSARGATDTFHATNETSRN